MQFKQPCHLGDRAQRTSTNGAYQWLCVKPLNAATRPVLVPYCLGGRHGHCHQCNKKHKTQLGFNWQWSYFVTCYLHGFRNTKQTLYSAHQCKKLCGKVDWEHCSWWAQVIFDVFRVLSWQKWVKILIFIKPKKVVADVQPWVLSC